MKYLLSVFGMILLSPSFAFASVFISEIAVNTNENSSGGSEDNKKEWVELYNNDIDDVDISGWRVEYTTSSGSVYFYTIPDLTVIPSGKTFVLVNNKDEFNHEFSDLFSGDFLGLEMTGSLNSQCNQSTRCFRFSNTKSGLLALFDATDIQQDSLTWNDDSFADNSIFKGTSLCRLKDLTVLNPSTPMKPGERCDETDIIATPIPTATPVITPVPTPAPVSPTPSVVVSSSSSSSSSSSGSTSSSQTSSRGSGGANALVLEELRRTGTAALSSADAETNGVEENTENLDKETVHTIAPNIIEDSGTCSEKQFSRFPENRISFSHSDVYGLNAYNDLKQQKVVWGEALLSQNISRSEFSKIMTIARQDTLPCEWDTSFGDVLEDEWFFDFVKNMQINDIVHGYSDGYFYPYKSISLAESYKVFAIGFGYISQDQAEQIIAESGEEWFAPYKSILLEQGVLSSDIANISDENFITRGQAFIVLSDILQRIDGIKQ